ncbi:hypothetical protein Tco_1465449 [Tanacetum coccineum]
MRAIPDYYMSWRHSNSVITYSKPPAGSYSQADIRRLSARIVKLRDMPEGVLVLFGLSRTPNPILRDSNRNVMGIHDFPCFPEWTGSEVQEEVHYDVRPTLQRLSFYCTPPIAADVVIPNF